MQLNFCNLTSFQQLFVINLTWFSRFNYFFRCRLASFIILHDIKLINWIHSLAQRTDIIFFLFQIIEDHYHFEHKSLVKRSISPSHPHQRRLNDDERVVWSKQQRVKSRQKRDGTRLKPIKSFTSLLNDPKWPSMWYLVRIERTAGRNSPLSPANSNNSEPDANLLTRACIRFSAKILFSIKIVF